jgi:hypothetical protein
MHCGEGPHAVRAPYYVSGSGPVDDLPKYLSSTRAELTSLTALAIVIKVLGNSLPPWQKSPSYVTINECYENVGRYRHTNFIIIAKSI